MKMMDSQTKHRSGTTLTQTANKMNIERLADAHEILSTSVHSDEISEAIDWIADQEFPKDERHTSYKLGYLIASLAYSNAHVSDRVKALRAKSNNEH